MHDLFAFFEREAEKGEYEHCWPIGAQLASSQVSSHQMSPSRFGRVTIALETLHDRNPGEL